MVYTEFDIGAHAALIPNSCRLDTMSAAPPVVKSRQHRDAMRVLDALDRWDKRFESQFERQRSHDRKSFRGMLKVLLTAQNPVSTPCSRRALEAWIRNLSQGGLSFIYPGQFQDKRIHVCLNSSETGGIWFEAEVVRSRSVQDGFWEYGVLFLERVPG